MTEDAAIRIDLHSVEVGTLPTLWSSRPRTLVHVPIRVDRCCSNKTCLLPGNLTAPTTIIPLPGKSSVAPVSLLTPATVVAKLYCPKRGPWYHITWAHKVIAAYRARVARMHNLPSLVVPIGGKTIDQVRAFP